MHAELLVVGGGPAGYTAAFRAVDLGLNVVLVDGRERLGGTCLLEGCIPSKALLHAAKAIAEARELADWGIEFAAPTIDLSKLRARQEKLIGSLSGGLSQLAKRRNVQTIHGRAVFESSHRVRIEADGADVDAITFDRAIVATGSTPIVPSAFQIDSPRLMDSTRALALEEIPRRLLIVGGGYIGLELGTVYAALGSQTSVVEMTDGLLPGVDRDLVKPLAKRLSNAFEAVRLSTRVAKLVGAGDAIEATLEHEDDSSVERYDRVLISIGRRPSSSGVGLENTKAKIDDRGFIEIDGFGQTGDAKIFAVGDVAGQPMLAHKGTHEAVATVEHIAGVEQSAEKKTIPAVVFTDPEIAWAGLTEEEAKRQGREVETALYPWAASGRAQAVGRPDGLTKLLVDPQSERIVGVGIVGAGAGELIAEGVLAIERQTTARQLAAAVHPHPTLSETLAFAAEVYLGTATEIYKPRRDRRPKA